MGFVRDKISDLKTNSTWFDKRLSLRFKIANWILRDELRWNLACIQHEVDAIDRHNVTFNEDDVKSTKDKITKFYTGRMMKHIDELWKA